MSITTARKLKSGDLVFWADPDDGICSRFLNIASIEFKSADTVHITEKNGSELECFLDELS